MKLGFKLGMLLLSFYVLQANELVKQHSVDSEVHTDQICSQLVAINLELNSVFFEHASVLVLDSQTKTSVLPEFSKYEDLAFFAENSACLTGMKTTTFSINNQLDYPLLSVISNEDDCDGGNSYGLIKDVATDQVIALIKDSYIECVIPR